MSGCVESLEIRRLFAGAALARPFLLIAGYPISSNTIVVGLNPDQTTIHVSLSYQGRLGPVDVEKDFDVSKVRQVRIIGGIKADTITIDQTNGSFTIPVWIAAGTGPDTVTGGDEVDTIIGGFGNDSINGGNGNNLILGQWGDDTLIGGSGNDVMRGGTGNDSLVGGDGNDRLYGDAGMDTLLGGAGRDFLVGGPNHDMLDGGDGNDTLVDVNGPDTMMGEGGTDTFGVLRILRQTTDYDPTTDILHPIVLPKDSSSFWSDVLNGIIYPY